MAATLVLHKATTPKRTGPSVFDILFAICQLFCAAPIIGRSKFRIRLHYAWCFIFMITLLFAIYSVEALILKFPMFTVWKMLAVIELLGNILLVSISIFTSYGHSDCYRTFPERIQEIERRTRLYQRKGRSHQTPHNIDRKAAALLVIATVFYACALVAIFNRSKDVAVSLLYSVANVLPNANIGLFLGQYWVLIKYANLGYKGINDVLEEIRSQNQSNQRPYCSMVCSDSRGGAKAAIEDLRTAYAQLDNLVGDIHDIFGLAITVNFLTSFVTLSLQIFSFFEIPDGEKQRTSIILYTVLWALMHSCKIVSVLNVNRSLLTEKATTGSILNDIDTNEIETEDAISRFLLQLVTNKSIHAACGVIDLDMSFLGGILSALSIYVIFMIQVDLSEVTLTARAAAGSTNITTPTP